jgi:hypothetical protein
MDGTTLTLTSGVVANKVGKVVGNTVNHHGDSAFGLQIANSVHGHGAARPAAHGVSCVVNIDVDVCVDRE